MDQEHFFTSPLIGLRTMSDIARELEVPLEAVKQLIEKHRIPPARRAGVVRLWDAKGFQQLRRLLSPR